MDDFAKKLFRSKKSDDYRTPKWLFNLLNGEFNFDFDPCPFQHDLSKWDGLQID